MLGNWGTFHGFSFLKDGWDKQEDKLEEAQKKLGVSANKTVTEGISFNENIKLYTIVASTLDGRVFALNQNSANWKVRVLYFHNSIT